MRPSLHVRPLSSGQVAALEAHYRRTSVPAERTRCQMILWSHQGLTPPAIAALIRVDPETVRRTIRRFNATGFGACKTARARGGRARSPARGSGCWCARSNRIPAALASCVPPGPPRP